MVIKNKLLILSLVLIFLIISIVKAIDTISPKWLNQGQNSTHIPQGQSILLYAQGYDNETGLRYAWLENNETGQWQNKSIFYLYTFNDSSTIKNVTFNTRENRTVWISLPKNSNVISAKVKLKGYPYPNASLRTDDDTEDWWGWYIVSGSAGELRYPERAHDQNWNTAAQCTNLTYNWYNTVYCHIVENYTTPSYAKGAQITVKGACPFGCWMGPWKLYCWDYTANNWREIGSSGAWSSPGNITANITPESNWGCWGSQIISKPVVYDNIGDDSIYFPNNGTYYEGMITWYDESYPNSPYLNVGEDISSARTDDDTEDWWGWYIVSGSAGELRYPERAHDQNWNTAAQCTNLTYNWYNTVYCHIVENYTTPSYAKGAQITVKGACPFGCWMGTWKLYCWNWTKNLGYWNSTSNNSWIQIGESGAYSPPGNITVNVTPERNWDCWGPQVLSKPVVYDNIGDDSIYFPNNGTYYEGMITWYNRLNLDSDYEWQYSGVYSDTQTTSDFSKEINNYLLYCVPDASGYCNVSLMFHSNTAGRIELSELNVTYLSGNYLKSYNGIPNQTVWSSFTWKNDSIPAVTTVAWRIHYQDGEGNRNATNIMTFAIKNPTSCSLTGVTNHTYGSSDTIVCSCTGDGVTHLYRNGTLHDEWNNTSIIFGTGTSTWVCNITEGTNYATASNTTPQKIDKANPMVSLILTPSSPTVYENITIESCIDINPEADSKLYRNGIEITPSSLTLAAGTYNYVCNITGTENYTSASNSSTYVVDKKNANVQVYPVTQTIKYGNSVTQYCTDESNFFDCILYRDETQIINNTSYSPAIGLYNYKANISDIVNYTNYQTTSTLTVVNCTSDVDCDDSKECTDNVCNNPGTLESYCSYPNKPSGTQCGLARDCPDDICNGPFAVFYPDDGHDTCDGSGNCLEYSCALQYSYCTDNDPFDGFNSLECNAECDQDSDCQDKCFFDIRYYSGICDLISTCTCSYSTENCDIYDCTTPSLLTCEGIGTYSIKETGDNYSCQNAACSVVGKRDCNGPWTCDSEKECNQQSCGGSNAYCYYDHSYKWGDFYPESETDCSDGHDNDCDGLTDINDPDCVTTITTTTTTSTTTSTTTTTTIPDMIPPTATLIFPKNTTTYSTSKTVYLQVSINEATSWIGYSLNSNANVTLWTNKPAGTYDTYNISLPNFGSHNIIVYANDTSGNMGKSNKVYFTVKQGGGGNSCRLGGICILPY